MSWFNFMYVKTIGSSLCPQVWDSFGDQSKQLYISDERRQVRQTGREARPVPGVEVLGGRVDDEDVLQRPGELGHDAPHHQRLPLLRLKHLRTALMWWRAGETNLEERIRYRPRQPVHGALHNFSLETGAIETSGCNLTVWLMLLRPGEQS